MSDDLIPPSADDGLAALALALDAATIPFRQALLQIADALHDEAISRGWCSEYGDFVNELNARMPAEVGRVFREVRQQRTITFNIVATYDEAVNLESLIDSVACNYGMDSCSDYEHDLVD